jgi:hypothetical protein
MRRANAATAPRRACYQKVTRTPSRACASVGDSSTNGPQSPSHALGALASTRAFAFVVATGGVRSTPSLAVVWREGLSLCATPCLLDAHAPR